MALALQVVSSHVLGALDIEKALSVQEELANLLLPHAASEAETLKRPNFPRLLLLDGCSMNLEKAWEIRPFECFGFTCGVWQEKVDKHFLNGESLFNVEGAQDVRTNDLKGESHQGLRRLVAKHDFQ